MAFLRSSLARIAAEPICGVPTLRGLVFDRADLRNAHLNGADLTASLRDADLDDAELIGATLDGADLTNSRARRVVLGRASLAVRGAVRC